MTDAENTPTQPIVAAQGPAQEPVPTADAAQGSHPTEQAAHGHGHYLPGEGVALIIVAALLFAAFAFAVGWFGGSMSSRFEARRGLMMGRSYGQPGGYGRGYMMRPGQTPQNGQHYGYGYGFRGHGGPGFAPNGSNLATPLAQ